MVSIIMTAYNAENTIKRAVNSVISQSYKDIELIIVDDCSEDGTSDIIKTLEQRDTRIKAHRNETNVGAGLSRRKGIELLKGEYTLFLDSDDYIDSDYVERILKYAEDTKADIISTGLHIVDESGKLLHSKIPKKLVVVEGKDKYLPDEADVRRFLAGNLIRSSLWKDVVYSGRRFIEDTPTLFRLTYFADKIAIVPYAGMYYVQNPSSLIHTSSKLKNAIYMALASKDNYIFSKVKGISDSPDAFLEAMRVVQLYLGSGDPNDYKDELQELFIFFLNTFKF